MRSLGGEEAEGGRETTGGSRGTRGSGRGLGHSPHLAWGRREEQGMRWWLSRRTSREVPGTLNLFSFINGQGGFSVNGNDSEMQVQKGWGLPWDSVVKNLPTSAGDSGLIPGLVGAHALGAAESIHGS